MRIVKRILLAGTSLLLCLNLLTGCSWVSLGVLYGMLSESPDDSSDFYDPGSSTPDSSLADDWEEPTWENWMNTATGSATYPESGTVLISVYLDTGLDWTEEDVALTQQYLQIAVEGLDQKGQEYQSGMDVVYDSRQDPRLAVNLSLDIPDVEDDLQLTNRALDAALAEAVDYRGLMEEYQTDSVAFLVFLNDSGVSYTIPYYQGDSAEWYWEKCYLYLYDLGGRRNYENPATYAHEMLHLFGAWDLYETNDTDGVTQQVVDYIRSEYPTELMLTTYNIWGGYTYDRVPQFISPLTAYAIGWIEDCPELDQFPTLERQQRCCFSYW